MLLSSSPSSASLIARTICIVYKKRLGALRSAGWLLVSHHNPTWQSRRACEHFVINSVLLPGQANIWPQKQGDVPVKRFVLHHTLCCSRRWRQAEMEVKEGELSHILSPSTRRVWTSVCVRRPDVQRKAKPLMAPWCHYLDDLTTFALCLNKWIWQLIWMKASFSVHFL